MAIARGVRDLARRLGHNGDIFADRVPPLGTWLEEEAISLIRLYAQPRPRTERERRYLKQLARAAVLARPYAIDDQQQYDAKPFAAEPSAAIRRANRTARKGR